MMLYLSIFIGLPILWIILFVLSDNLFTNNRLATNPWLLPSIICLVVLFLLIKKIKSNTMQDISSKYRQLRGVLIVLFVIMLFATVLAFLSSGSGEPWGAIYILMVSLPASILLGILIVYISIKLAKITYIKKENDA